MGNISNPSINRWGLNLFWYRFWYTDKNYSLVVQQDAFITKLIHIFINYGILFPKNIFTNRFWYSSEVLTRNYYNEHNTKYYRVVNFKSEAMKINEFYYIRTKLKNVYYSRIWILRYQNWIIINFYAFQPPKNQTNNDPRRLKKAARADLLFTSFNKTSPIYKRLKMVCALFLKFNFFKSKYYYF
jgi:hypothetical protein